MRWSSSAYCCWPGASLVPFLRNAAVEPATVEVWQNGVLTRQVPAMSPGDLRDLRHVHQHRHRRLWQSGRHPIPDCPTQDCVHTGWISYTGQTIVCLPNGVEVRLTGGGAEPEIDGVSR